MITKYKFIIGFLLITLSFSSLPVLAQTSPVIQNQNFQLQGKQHLLFGINYYPQKTPWTQFWPRYNRNIIEADLQRIKTLGFNTFRIFVLYNQFGANQVKPAMKSKLKDLLNRAHKKGLKVIVTLFDFYGDYKNVNGAKSHLKQIVSGLENHPAIFAWDLKNEGDRDYKYGKGLIVNWVKTMANYLRQLDNNHLITAGWSKATTVKDIAPYLDYVTFHYYLPEQDFDQTIQSLRKQTNKPIVLGEFGYHTWKKSPKDPHFIEHQYNYFNSILGGVLKQNLAGSLVWCLYDFPPNTLETKMLKEESFQNHMGLVDVRGKSKYGLKALQQLAFLRDADTGKTIQSDTKNIELIYRLPRKGTVELSVYDSKTKQTDTTKLEGVAGTNVLQWPLNKELVKRLIYMEVKYFLKAKELLGLNGKVYQNKRIPLKIRER